MLPSFNSLGWQALTIQNGHQHLGFSDRHTQLIIRLVEQKKISCIFQTKMSSLLNVRIYSFSYKKKQFLCRIWKIVRSNLSQFIVHIFMYTASRWLTASRYMYKLSVLPLFEWTHSHSSECRHTCNVMLSSVLTYMKPAWMHTTSSNESMYILKLSYCTFL